MKKEKYLTYNEENKTWDFRFSAGRHADGSRRQIRRRGFKTKTEAKQEMERLKAELMNDKYVNPSNMMLGQFLLDWIEMRRASILLTTYQRYKREILNNINPILGDFKLQQITALDIAKALVYFKEEKGFSKSTLDRILVILNAAFEKAIVLKLLRENPVKAVDRPTGKVRQMAIWEKELIKRFLDIRKTNEVKKNKYYRAILVSLLTGMRKGEILALSWDNVDLENSEIYVERTLDDMNEVQDRTKTITSTRKIKISKVVVEELKKVQIIQLKERKNFGNGYNPLNLVFCTRSGKRVCASNLNRLLKSICENYGFPVIRFHDLRHSFASYLISQGISAKVVQELLGHTDVATTLRSYTHTRDSMHEEAVGTIDKLI